MNGVEVWILENSSDILRLWWVNAFVFRTGSDERVRKMEIRLADIGISQIMLGGATIFC